MSRPDATSTIGGDFELDPASLPVLATTAARSLEHSTLPVTGRAALHRALARLVELRPHAPLYLPDYLCDSMLAAARATSAYVRLYNVGPDLRIDDPTVIAPGSIVVVVRYFGLVDLPAEVRRVRAAVPGAMVVADEAHAPWELDGRSEPSAGADVAFTSWRKAYPVVGGAPILPSTGDRAEPRGAAGVVGDEFAATRLAASALKRLAQTDFPVDDSAYLALFARAEALLDAPSALVMRLSETWTPLLSPAVRDAMNARRRRNFGRLELALSARGIRPLAPLLPGATPLFFPVRVRDRNAVRRRLADERIFCPVHWPRPNALPDTEIGDVTRLLYEEELSLVIDFRYGDDDMDRLADAVGRALPRKESAAEHS